MDIQTTDMNASSAKKGAIIRTPDQRLRVFVSSTLKEMAEERSAAREAIQGLRLAAVMFELGARPHAAQDLYRAYLEQSHIFIGIYGEQYGWVAPGESISGLEEEYDIAGGKPKLVYIKKPASNREPRLAQMLARIRDRDKISYKYFSTVEELKELIEADLALLLTERFELSEHGRNLMTEERTQTIESMRKRERTNLPTRSPTELIGRAAEVEKARHLLLEKTRLLTLTGPGGSGKTRLAVEVAQTLIESFDRVHYVDLASISDPALVPDALARVLEIREIGAASAEELVIGRLSDSNSLLVLDNFEQVSGASPFVVKLLEACPKTKVLVTSRVSLRIRGEIELPTPPLLIPEPGTSLTPRDPGEQGAVELFCERARAVKPDFSLTAENAGIITEICRRLDGLPLAIELAAPRVRLLSAEALLNRLERRLPLLSGGPHDLPDRQKTMRNTIAWSYDLLNETEAALFRAMAVFVGGCTMPAVREVFVARSADELELLDTMQELAAKNLIYVRQGQDGEPRISMFETIREYAGEKISESGEEEEIRKLHAQYFSQLAETAEPFLTSGDRDPWMSRLEAELDNIRAVLRRSLEGSVDPLFGVRTAGTLGWFWHLRGHLSEGRAWASSLAELPEASGRTRERAKVLFPAGGLAWSQGDYKTCDALLSESGSIFREIGDLQGLLNAQAILAGGVASLGDYDRALKLCEETMALMRKTDDQWGLSFILLWHGDIVIAKTGDTATARSMFEESLSLAETKNDPWIRAEALNHLGMAAGMQDDFKNAHGFFEESLRYHEATGDRWAVARGLAGYADVLTRQSMSGKAKDILKQSMRIWWEMGNRLGVVTCITGLAQVAAAEGRSVRAARLYGAAPDPVRTVGYLFFPRNPRQYDAGLAPARKALGEEAWGEEMRRGQAMTLEQTFRYALENRDEP
jgi:predicted ATPase